MNINDLGIDLYVALIAFLTILAPTVHRADRRYVHPIRLAIVSACVTLHGNDVYYSLHCSPDSATLVPSRID